MNKILFCKKCDLYTIKEYCENCNSKTLSPKPARFSPADRHSKYRILAKKQKGQL